MKKVEKVKGKLFNIFRFKIIDFVLLPLIALIIALFIVLPKIYIKGDSVVSISYKSSYNDKGVSAKFLGKDITSSVETTGSVNTEKLGKYTITYTIDDYLIPIKKTRVVNVVDDTKPVITLVGDKNINICPNSDYKEEGYTALDDYDGDITKKVNVDAKDNKIIYTVKDSSGNSTKVTRKIEKKDITSPYINLNGLTDIYLKVGNTFTEPGYVANDNCEGNITDKVVVTGSVDTNSIGEYLLNYKVEDSSGNATDINRKVIITSNIDPNSGVRKNGVIYLTFDDGPQDGTTNVILDILKEEGVKATFFVTNKGPDELIKREADEGHTVALHTATHDYSIVYASDEAYFNDLQQVHDRVQRITGLDSRIIRFPGGSSNTVSRRYSVGIMSRITQEVLNRGYRYYDWNISSGDAGETTDPNQVYLNVINNLSKDRPNMVLCHDIKWYTRDALRNIIKYGKDNGYTFEPITMETAMVRQRVNN